MQTKPDYMLGNGSQLNKLLEEDSAMTDSSQIRSWANQAEETRP
jgi:hypothetical protein